MGKKGGSSKEAAIARADEQQRQADIRAGTARVNSIFDGGAVSGKDALAADAVYDPTKTYYRADGTVWSPSAATSNTGNVIFDSVANSQGGALTPADMFKRDVASGAVYGGVNTNGGGFNNDFYTKQRQSFLDYANPQLESQYGDAKKELTYSLARSGLLDSSVRASKEAELQKKYDLNKQQIADQALSYETDARNNVEKARSDLITMLNATGDASGAANSAMARASALSQPQAFSPITQLFSDFTSALGTQAAIEKANSVSAAYGGPQYGRYNTGLFGNSKSVSVSK